MKRRILKALRITPAEVTPVFLLLAIGFCIGLFLATIAVAATTLFLNSYSETEDLPIALLISGAFSIFFTGFYSFFQGKVSFNALAISTLLIFIVLTSFIEFGNEWIENDNLLYYFAFTLILPFTFVSRLIFWGAFNRLFNIHQTRRILGTIDIGMDIASVIAFFAIPVILKLGVDIVSIFSISLVSIIGFLILYIILSGLFPKGEAINVADRQQQLSTKAFFKSKYILSLSLFIVLSTIATRFVDYSFFNATASQFSSQDLPYFLSYFEATIVTFSFLFTVFITDRINHEYGTRVSLLINPLLMLIFMFGALGLGYFMGYNQAISETAYFFFIMIAMGKLFIDSMKEAIDEPTLKFYYIPFDKSIKNDIQTKIEGVVMGFASLIAGGMIVLINRFKIFDLLSIILFIIAVIVLWYWVINYMYKNYHNTLRNSLQKNKSGLDQDNTKGYTMNSMLVKKITKRAEEKVIYSLKLIEKLDPSLFEHSILKLVNTPLRKVKRYVKDKIEEFGIGSSADSLLKDLAKQAAGEAENSELLSISPDRLITLGKSVKQSDRLFATKLLRKLVDDRTIFTLLELLRDQDFKVREAALVTARKVKRPETWNILIEMLNSPLHSNHAASALREAGEPALEYLNFAFYKAGQSDLVMQKIIKIIGDIGGVKSISLMWQKADYPDVKIVRHILHSLADTNYTVKGDKTSMIKGLLDTEIGKMIWNLAALDELPNEPHFGLLKEALNEETQDNYEQIILMLSLLYDRQSVQLVKQNIDSESSDSTAYAIELLNLFIDADLKAKLIPLLDSTPTSDKLEKLQPYFPRERYDIIQLINTILNRSFSHCNRWTKLCAAHAVAYTQHFPISQSLIAQVFNRDKILQETVAWVIYNKDKEAYNAIVSRLPTNEKNFLDSSIENNQLIDGLDDGYFLGIEVVMFIKKLAAFKNTKGKLLCDLVDKVKQIMLQKGEKKKFDLNEDHSPILIAAFGNLTLFTEDDEKISLKRGTLFGEVFQNEPSPKIAYIHAKKYAVAFSIQVPDFYFVLANHHELAYTFIENEGIDDEALVNYSNT